MNNWINVKDQLPEKHHKVLFHWIYDGHNRHISMGYLCDKGWDIYLPYSSYKLSNEFVFVTHWMELPAFPVPESEQEVHDIIKKMKSL